MKNNQLTIVVAIIRNEKGDILFAKRHEPENPEIHNKWEFPGGKIEFGEDPETAVIREAWEETGLNVKVKRLLPKIITHVWEGNFTVKTYQVIVLSYECEVVSGKLANNDPKISELRYFATNEINYADCLPKMKEIIELLQLEV